MVGPRCRRLSYYRHELAARYRRVDAQVVHANNDEPQNNDVARHLADDPQGAANKVVDRHQPINFPENDDENEFVDVCH